MERKYEELSARDVMAELAAIGFARPGDFLISGELDDLSRVDRAAVASVERSGQNYKVKFYDKLKALELLGRYMGLFDTRQEGDPSLLGAIVESTKEDLDWDAVPEIQPAAAAGNDLVEQTRNGGV